MKKRSKAPFTWLDRAAARPAPYLTLVRSQEDYAKALAAIGCSVTDEWVSDAGKTHGGATCHYRKNKEGDVCCIVGVNVVADSTGIEVAGLLVHEAVHVAQAYFESFGEADPAREQQAYAIQMISQELMWEYKRQTT